MNQRGSGSIPRLAVWVEFDVFLVLAPRGFSSGAPVFPSPQTQNSKFRFDLESAAS